MCQLSRSILEILGSASGFPKHSHHTASLVSIKFCRILNPIYSLSPVSKTHLQRPQTHAHAPIKLIQNAPKNTSPIATTLLFPRKVFQLSSDKKSSPSKSIKLVYVNKPAEIAFMIPTTNNPVCESGEYRFRVAMPRAWPSGVLGGERQQPKPSPGFSKKSERSFGAFQDLRAPIRQRHAPRLQCFRLPTYRRDPRPKSEAFESLVERYGD